MTRRFWVRVGFASLVTGALVLSAATASAAPARRAEAEPDQWLQVLTTLVDRGLDLVRGVFLGPGGVDVEKEGIGMDPDGARVDYDPDGAGVDSDPNG